MRLYIAGPMRGKPFANFPAFDAAAFYVRSLGHDAINPADHDRDVYPDCETWDSFPSGQHGSDARFDMGLMMGWDLKQIVDADGIVLLPGWENSVGTGHELYVAKATGKAVYYLEVGTDGEGRDVPGLRYECSPTIVGLMGYAQAGKDTVASILMEHAKFTRVAFADTLRDMLYALNPEVTHPDPSYGEQRLRDVVRRGGWEQAKVNYPEVRALLQRLGTEAGRQVLGENIWVDTAMKKVEPGGRYVFTDVRYPNEAKAITSAGGRLARVVRPGYGPVNAHISETAVDDVREDVTICNNGTIEDLIVPVRQLLDPAFARV